MKKATHLGEVISFFDPMQSLDCASLEWYVERPDSAHMEIKNFLLNDRTDSKILSAANGAPGKHRP